jgi:1,4-dihydroxy-2-naphthoate octaprenyltransferase
MLAARPKTLIAAVIPVFTAGALVHWMYGSVLGWVLFCGLFSAMAIQIATNLINDAIDFDKGADTNERIGPQRVTQSGVMTKAQVYRAAIIMLVIAAVLGLPLVIHGGLPILILGLVSLFLAYSYTGGPFPLAYLGLGDLFVILFFGWVAVGGIFYLLTGQYSLEPFVLGLQIGCLATVLIAINNFRDIHQDRKANKMTLAVRFGPAFMRTEIFVLLMLPFLLQIFWLYKTQNIWMLAPLLLLPVALRLALNVGRTEPSVQYNQFLARAAQIQGGFGAILSLVFMTT